MGAVEISTHWVKYCCLLEMSVVGCPACASAYSAEASASAITICQSGCKGELPAVENRLHQVSNTASL